MCHGYVVGKRDLPSDDLVDLLTTSPSFTTENYLLCFSFLLENNLPIYKKAHIIPNNWKFSFDHTVRNRVLGKDEEIKENYNISNKKSAIRLLEVISAVFHLNLVHCFLYTTRLFLKREK